MREQDVKDQLSVKAEGLANPKLTKSMNIADMIKAIEPEIKKALPAVMTPERFTRIALSALNTTPKLGECSQMSFLAALMNAAQLGLEVNTPLGQAYLIPYNNKGKLECQFQIGYKGMLGLAYRNPELQTIQAQTVYENDEFEYELGLNSRLVHKPTLENRGEVRCYYALYKLKNGGYGFEVMSREDVEDYAKKYSKATDSAYSPWSNSFDSMAKKTVIKQLLKYAPLKTDLEKAMSMDESIKTNIAVDMSEVENDNVIDVSDTEES